MTRLFPVLDQYQPRFLTPLVIAAGSDLAADDVDGVWPSISEVVMGSLSAAHDHLVAVQDHVLARKLYVYADASLLRSALLPAAQAVWVLAPEDRADRQRRCRILVAHEYFEHLKYLKDLSRSRAARSSTDTPSAVRAAEFQEAVAGVADALARRRQSAGERVHFNATDVIKEACDVAFPDDPATAQEVLAEWRHGSSAAHGLNWHVLGKIDTRVTVVDEERMVIASRASLDDLVPSFVHVAYLLTQGFSLLDQRNTGPTPF